MTNDQIILFALFGAVLGLLLWGRIRYDVVAFGALVIGVILGVVPEYDAFSGFGHPATIIVALVLVVSKGLMNSGVVGWITRTFVDTSRKMPVHIASMAGLGAALSGFMNNVAALALLMPVDIEAAKRAGRGVGATLMPLSFATILGGLITLIGTPPNIIIAAFREDALGAPFAMFDFAPVGLACALAGVSFIALVGWRLIPRSDEHNAPNELMDLRGYITELTVTDDSPVIGRRVRDLDDDADELGVRVLGLVRRGKRLPGGARREEIRAGDHIVIEAGSDAIDTLTGQFKLTYSGEDRHRTESGSDIALIEAVVPQGSRLEGRSADSMRLLYRHGVSLLGVSRQGRPFRERVRRLPIEAGDLLLLLGPPGRFDATASDLDLLPLADRSRDLIQHGRAPLAGGLFIAAVVLASLNLVPLTVALAAVVIMYVLLDIVPLRRVYEEIEWPVVVLLGSMIPIGAALEQAGGTQLIAAGLVDVSAGLPAWAVLTLLLIVTMTLSDVLNNTATTIVAAPVAIDVADKIGANPDAFLMAVAIGASCAFLTPIGHKNNTLIMGPGGYRFGDYWPMGLPLEIIVTAVAVPMILIVWPLGT